MYEKIQGASSDERPDDDDDDELDERNESSDLSRDGDDDSSYSDCEEGLDGPDEEERDSHDKPSNEKLLCTAFISFQSFALIQIGAAYVAGSEAMMGDSAAMMVDALTYLFNLLAERQKRRFRAELLELKRQSPTAQTYADKALQCRKRTLQMELLPPVISVSTLLVVTGFVLHQAVKVLILDRTRDISEQKNPSLKLMLAFSCGNLVLDVVNVTCFAKAEHAFGYNTDVESLEDEEGGVERDNNGAGGSNRHRSDKERTKVDKKKRRPTERKSLLRNDSLTVQRSQSHGSSLAPLEIETRTSQILDEQDGHDDDGHDHANLNMCSAYTHVFADTLRSFAVIVAGTIAMLVDAVTPEEADATAAVIVSGLILVSLIPLFSGLVRTSISLQEVFTLERKRREAATLEDGNNGDINAI